MSSLLTEEKESVLVDSLELVSGKTRKIRGCTGRVWNLRFLHPLPSDNKDNQNAKSIKTLWLTEIVDSGDNLMVKFDLAQNSSEWELLLQEAVEWKSASDYSLKADETKPFSTSSSRTKYTERDNQLRQQEFDFKPIVRLLDYAKTPYMKNCMIFIVEYIQQTTLNPPLSEDQLLPYVRDILQGILIMRDCGITVHGELCLGSIVTTKDLRAKISCFGLKRRKVAAGIETALHHSPESLDKEDVYQVGLIAFELMFGKKPFEGVENDPFCRIEAAFGRVVFPSSASEKFSSQTLDLVRRCLSKSIVQRPDSFALSYMVAAAQGLVPPVTSCSVGQEGNSVTGRNFVENNRAEMIPSTKNDFKYTNISVPNNSITDEAIGGGSSEQFIEMGRGLSRDDLYLLHLYHVPQNITRGPWESYHRPGSFESSIAKATTNSPTPAKSKHIRWILIDVWEKRSGALLFDLFVNHLRSPSVVIFKYLTVIYKVLVDGPPEFLELAYRQDQIFEYLERTWSKEHLQNVSLTEDVYLFSFAGDKSILTLLRLKSRLFHDFSAVFDGSWSKLARYQQRYQQQLLLTVRHGHTKHADGIPLEDSPDPLEGKRRPLLHAFGNLIEHCFQLSNNFLSCNDPCRELKVFVIPSLAVEISKAYFASLSCFYALTQYCRERGDFESLCSCYNVFRKAHQRTYTFVEYVLSESDIAALCRDGTLPKLCFDIAPAEAFFEPNIRTREGSKVDERRDIPNVEQKRLFKFDGELRELLNMGFTRESAQKALENTNGNVNAAVAELVDDFASPDKIAKLLDSRRPIGMTDNTTKKTSPEGFKGVNALTENPEKKEEERVIRTSTDACGNADKAKPRSSEGSKITLSEPRGWEQFRQRLVAESSVHSVSERGYHVEKQSTPVFENGSELRKGRPRASSAVELSPRNSSVGGTLREGGKGEDHKGYHGEAKPVQHAVASPGEKLVGHAAGRHPSQNKNDMAIAKKEVDVRRDREYRGHTPIMQPVVSDAIHRQIIHAPQGNLENFEKPHPSFCHCIICETAKNLQKVSVSTKNTPFTGGSALIRSLNPAFEIDPSEIEWGPLIGQGGFGQVYKARFRGTTVAVKTISATALVNQNAIKEFQSEVAVLCTLRHPNVILFMGACIRSPHLFIVTEFMSRGTLFDILHRYRIPVNWNLMKRMALDVCRGMTYLHASKLLHRDLKSSNLMLDDHFTLKVGDFGLTRLISTQTQGPMTGQCGTFQYMAPEVLANQPYSEKADVYSFGIILWEMTTKQLPYYGIQPMQVAVAVLSKQMRPPIPPQCPTELAQLIQTCWHQDPNRRPSFPEIMKILEQMPA
eukprot:jgi/Galph1/5733/GphlegSOOS_G4318.1